MRGMSVDIFELRLPGQDTTLAAPADRTLLQTLQAGGQHWTSSCRNGSCRSCMGRLETGAVHYRIAWPGLSAEEKAEGLVLPCVACPVGDLSLRFVGL
jgi:ferredoxin